MIKYIGSKRLLIPKILELVGELDGVTTVCDLFSGTSRVGYALKEAGYRVHSNDLMSYAHVLAQTFVASDSSSFPADALEDALQRMNALPGHDGYFTQKFSVEAPYFQAHNATRIDAIRSAIDDECPQLQPALLASLMLAADKVDSTVGVQMAYLKKWAARSFNPMTLLPPPMLPGPGAATCLDAVDLAPKLDLDLVYLDPPYNQHSYLGNYHIWESLVRNDCAETYGKANKRIDCKTRTSPFNLKSGALGALESVIRSLKCRHLILSFSDEGHVSREAIESLLASWGDFKCVQVPHRRYVGARIGIYGPSGKKVGKVSHLNNREYLFVAKRINSH